MAGIRAAGIALVVALAVVAAIAFYPVWQHWAAVRTGSSNTQGAPPNYNYWSGFGSVFPWSMGILAALLNNGYQAARRTNCHTHKCWRIGAYPVEGYRVCKKHHFEVKGTHPTIEHLREVHVASLEVADNQDEAGSAVAARAGCSSCCAGPAAPAS